MNQPGQAAQPKTAMRMPLLLSTLCLLAQAQPVMAQADTTPQSGLVVYQAAGCPHFFVETPEGFSWLEWHDGDDVAEAGDEIRGDLASYGVRDVYNATARVKLIVQVRGYWIAPNQAIMLYRESCASALPPR
jgi:hypothetical protein